jgi:uncharacterized protein (DUF2252 family)
MPRVLRRAVLCAMLAVGGCRASQGTSPNDGPLLLVEPERYDFAKSPGLLDRVVASPFGYYRLINATFTNEVCHRFKSEIDRMPSVNLHGDAHLEQYAITDVGRGLTDFDDSASGPAILDLVRFGTSIHLAARTRDWQAEVPKLMSAFLDGYREALEKPELQPDPPGIVVRVQSSFHFDHQAFFGWIESITEGMGEQLEKDLRAALEPYFEEMRKANPEIDPAYFKVQMVGRPRIGIGSALDRKYLVRIRGPSDAPEDDEILELKEVRDLSKMNCVDSQRRGPFRALVAQARLAYQPSHLLGYVRLGQDYFWVHAWVKSYEEISAQVFTSPDELAQVARDVGVQLGKGHTKAIAAPFDDELRRETRQFVDRNEKGIRDACAQLADEVEIAWREFRRRVGR